MHPKGIFSSTVVVITEGKEIATMQMNWKGYFIIAFQGANQYVLKVTGIWGNKYVVHDENDILIMTLDADFTWSKCNYNYKISYDIKPRDLLLVLLATYSANYYLSAMSGVM